MCAVCRSSVAAKLPDGGRLEASDPERACSEQLPRGQRGSQISKLSRAIVTMGDRAEVYGLALWQVR
jgi:hypothetical protein